MPADLDSTGWITAILSALGINAAGWVRMNVKQGQHEVRINALEGERKEHARKIEDTHTTVTGLEVKISNIESKLDDIQGMVHTVLQLSRKMSRDEHD